MSDQITCDICGEGFALVDIVDHLRLFHPDALGPVVEPELLTPDEEGRETARVTIVRRITDDDVIDFVEAVDTEGDDLPLTEALGMIRLAEDTLIRGRMGE